MRTLVLFAVALGSTAILAGDASAFGKRKKQAAAVVASPCDCGSYAGMGYSGGAYGVGYGQPAYGAGYGQLGYGQPAYGVGAPAVVGGFHGQPLHAGAVVNPGLPGAMPAK